MNRTVGALHVAGAGLGPGPSAVNRSARSALRVPLATLAACSLATGDNVSAAATDSASRVVLRSHSSASVPPSVLPRGPSCALSTVVQRRSMPWHADLDVREPPACVEAGLSAVVSHDGAREGTAAAESPSSSLHIAALLCCAWLTQMLRHRCCSQLGGSRITTAGVVRQSGDFQQTLRSLASVPGIMVPFAHAHPRRK
jgi:hypothetical protein